MKTSSRQRVRSSPHTARAVDHLVLPVSELAIARKRLEALGFTVADDARHPFGTENCCVFLADGTYLEPLGIDKRESCEAAALKGNVFIARDQAYRFRRGEDGFSAIAFASEDAAADQAHFRKLGFSAGRLLRFSRVFVDAEGKRDRLSFRLAFAADMRAPDAFFFTCERVNASASGRCGLERHTNGAIGMREVAMGEPNPSDFQYVLEEVVGTREVNAHSFGIELMSTNVNVAAYSPAGMKAWFGDTRCGHGRGLKLRAVVFAVADLDKTRALFKENAIAFDEIAGRVVVQPAPGQGAIFAFEAAK